jgi:hypothetical protein
LIGLDTKCIEHQSLEGAVAKGDAVAGTMRRDVWRRVRGVDFDGGDFELRALREGELRVE